MPIEYRIGVRYTRSKNRTRFIDFISLISVIGVAIGVTVIIAVLSVMNGFKTEVRQKMLSFTSHVSVTGFAGELGEWRSLENLVETHPDIVALAPFAEAQAMILNQDLTSGIYLRGVLPEYEARVSDIPAYMTSGTLDTLEEGGFHIILGAALAQRLNVGVGDKVIVISPQVSVSVIGIRPRMKRFTIGGIFNVGMPQFDRHVALVHLRDAQLLLQLGDSVSGTHLRLRDLFKAPEVTYGLRRDLGPDYWVSDWTQRHKAFFNAIEMEKTILGIIMTLIILVAIFNIVSTLVMVVVEKRGDIAILKTMGMTPRRILRIFITQGCLIGGAGTLLGGIGGVALGTYLSPIAKWIESASGRKFLPPDVYPISEVPSELMFTDVAFTMFVAFTMTVLATLYPAWRAASMQPAQILRYG